MFRINTIHILYEYMYIYTIFGIHAERHYTRAWNCRENTHKNTCITHTHNQNRPHRVLFGKFRQQEQTTMKSEMKFLFGSGHHPPNRQSSPLWYSLLFRNAILSPNLLELGEYECIFVFVCVFWSTVPHSHHIENRFDSMKLHFWSPLYCCIYILEGVISVYIIFYIYIGCVYYIHMYVWILKLLLQHLKWI